MHEFPEFSLDDAQGVAGFWYLGTPYTHYAGGRDIAFRHAAIIRGKLIRLGVSNFCPIVHSHPVAQIAGLDPTDHAIWVPDNRPLMERAHGLIIVQLVGWQTSRGLAHEIDHFNEAGKPILALPLYVVADWILETAPAWAATVKGNDMNGDIRQEGDKGFERNDAAPGGQAVEKGTAEIRERRNDATRLHPVEKMILQAQAEVECLGASRRLTDAAVHLGAAREALADHIDGIERGATGREAMAEGEAAAGGSYQQPKAAD